MALRDVSAVVISGELLATGPEAELRKLADPVETPSGKGAADENFPVGSWLLPPALRPHVATYYAFARAIDDIADNPGLAPEVKVARLEAMAAVLRGDVPPTGATAKAGRLRESMTATQVSLRHGLDLVIAFKQDAVKSRYDDWDDLLAYCNNSASPVGRYLLDLHRETKSYYPASDALCNALQVVNHLQDCGDDRRNLDRVYLPMDWMAEAGASVEDLDRSRLNPGLRRVIDRCLDGVETLLEVARLLPLQLQDRRLAMESGIIVRIAEVLCGQLRARDPLAERVVLSKSGYARCAARGLARTLLGRMSLASVARARSASTARPR